MKKADKHSERDRLEEIRLGSLTQDEADVLRRQIRRNSITTDRYVTTIDLLVNKERCPEDANTLLALRKRLEIAALENDTFRQVLWRHVQMVEQLTLPSQDSLHPASFLISRIKSRKCALGAQRALK